MTDKQEHCEKLQQASLYGNSWLEIPELLNAYMLMLTDSKDYYCFLRAHGNYCIMGYFFHDYYEPTQEIASVFCRFLRYLQGVR